MTNAKPVRIKSISEFHQFNGLPAPEHPLISIVDYAKMKRIAGQEDTPVIFGYYTISLKRGVSKMFYGQQEYDFDEGLMYFMAPGQLLRPSNSQNHLQRSGWLLLIHPDFLWNTPLAKKIGQYEFFDYSVNEALFLSEKEEKTVNNIVDNIRQEYHTNIDKFTQDIIIPQIETLLNYSERFYQRQFITRKITNHSILNQLETILNEYFSEDDLALKGLPTVQFLAKDLNVSPKYLSTLLKVLTGQTALQHIHEKLIEKAKQMLSTTDLSVSEIAYQLGFEYPQSFNKLFKNKTKLSPLAFRESFN
ncbi:MAG TPA: helix-turn-helix transcriptional regulator [Arachidicoccus sp.]